MNARDDLLRRALAFMSTIVEHHDELITPEAERVFADAIALGFNGYDALPEPAAAGDAVPDYWIDPITENAGSHVRRLESQAQGEDIFAECGMTTALYLHPPAQPEQGDANVNAVRAKLLQRSEVGQRKYGVTTDSNVAMDLLESAKDFCTQVFKGSPHVQNNAAVLRNQIDVFLQSERNAAIYRELDASAPLGHNGPPFTAARFGTVAASQAAREAWDASAPSAGGDVSAMVASATERIWLQADADGDRDTSAPIPHDAWGHEMTWCAESVDGSEVEYVRADLALRARDAEIARLRDENAQIRTVADEAELNREGIKAAHREIAGLRKIMRALSAAIDAAMREGEGK